jgi:hypothetical protein
MGEIAAPRLLRWLSTLHGLWATTMNESEGGPIYVNDRILVVARYTFPWGHPEQMKCR